MTVLRVFKDIYVTSKFENISLVITKVKGPGRGSLSVKAH